MYGVILGGTNLLMVLMIIDSLTGDSLDFIGAILGALFLCLFLWVTFGTGYKVEEDVLIVRSGPLRTRIKIEEINSISSSNSIWSAPALATNRLAIDYGYYNGTLLSPKRESEFISLLLEKNPKIKVEEKLLP